MNDKIKRKKCRICQSDTTPATLKKKVIAGDGVQYVLQCDICGGDASSPIAYKMLTGKERCFAPLFDQDFKMNK